MERRRDEVGPGDGEAGELGSDGLDAKKNSIKRQLAAMDPEPYSVKGKPRSSATAPLGSGSNRACSGQRPPDAPLPLAAEKMCLKHGKVRGLICVTCRSHVCDTCALFGLHKGHDVRQKNELGGEIKLKMELLMENFLLLEKAFEEIKAQDVFHTRHQQMAERKASLENALQLQIQQWKTALDGLKDRMLEQIEE